jgi:transposase
VLRLLPPAAKTREPEGEAKRVCWAPTLRSEMYVLSWSSDRVESKVTPGAQYCVGIGQRKCTTCLAGDDRLSSHARPVRTGRDGGSQEVWSALEWVQVRAMAADGVSQRAIARRLGINRRTVKRLLESDEPPTYRRASRGSKVDRFEPATLDQWPDIKAPRMTDILRDEHGYEGSVDVVKRRLRDQRPPSDRPAQRTGYRPGQVLQLDWLELPTRPRIAGRQRRIYALFGTLPYSAAQSAQFSFDMTAESFLEGHVRILEWLGGVPRECVYDNLRSVVVRRERDVIHWNRRFLHLRGH